MGCQLFGLMDHTTILCKECWSTFSWMYNCESKSYFSRLVQKENSGCIKKNPKMA